MSDNPNNSKAVPATGNASNRSPEEELQIVKSLIDEQAEKYLKESANIEDMPDPKEDEEAIRETRKDEP